MMAVPEYFGRNAVAAAQAISGLDERRLADLLENVRIGITIGSDAEGPEGQALSDLLIRLLARLYPALVIRVDRGTAAAQAAQDLALRVNPRVDLTGRPTLEIVVGLSALEPWASERFYVGSNGWTATFSTSRPRSCGKTDVPFGAGVAACLAAANVFRRVFLPERRLDADATFAVLDSTDPAGIATLEGSLGDVVLAGAGAIGNAAAWALARLPMSGTLAVVDHEAIDLGNMQRYVLAERADEDAPKPSVVARYFDSSLKGQTYPIELAQFAERHSHRIDRLLLALDSARDRRAGQASLPRWVANGWTQPGDLGVSTHDFLRGACVSCLYLPNGALKNEDAIIADTFGVPERIMQIRLLLFRQTGVPRDLLEAIASAKEVSLDSLLPFEGRPVRALYSEGFCGGAVIPLTRLGAPRAEVHVPLAHQSALAGVLLAAAVVRHALGNHAGSSITQLDVLKPLQRSHTRAAAKDPRGICICQDPDYRAAYAKKFDIAETD
jgi:hypothetical protein